MDTPISNAIKAKGLSDAQVAAMVGCERSMVTKIKLGKATPSLPLALKLADALELPVANFAPKQGRAA